LLPNDGVEFLTDLDPPPENEMVCPVSSFCE